MLPKLAFERSSLFCSLWHAGERSWQTRVGQNCSLLICLLTGKWEGTQSYLYFPKWSAAFVDVQHTNVSWQMEKENELNQKKTLLTLPLRSLTSVFQPFFLELINKKYAGLKLTDFESCLLSRAVVVHLADKRAHLYRVLVLMVQTVSLKGTKQSQGICKQA